jgi:putative ABC transport system permease protein
MSKNAMNGIMHDLSYAMRSLVKAPGFTTAAVVTLALGIAGTTVMFALIEGVLLRPLPVHEQNRLVVAWKELRSSGFAHYPFGDTEIEAVGRESRLLENVAGVTRNGVEQSVIVEDGTSNYVMTAFVTGGFFDVLGIEALLGRPLTRADDVDGAEHVLVISYRLWQRRYGGSREVIGRRVMLSEQAFTIVGVMPPDIDYPSGVEVWRTTRSVPTNGPFGDAVRREVDLVARLRPGVTVEQARSELTALTKQMEVDRQPNAPRGLIPVVRPFDDVVVGDVRTAMLALFAAVGLVLLIANANVANLLLMRGEGRRPELAVRAALGAGRGRIVRQLLAESLILALVAGTAGFVVALWSLQAVMALIPDGLPRVESVRIDAIVVLFTVTVALVTALLAGLVPALSSMRLDLVSQLRSGGRGVAGSADRYGRRALIVAQVALAVTIVAAAGLLTRSLLKLQSVDTGLAAERLVFVEVTLPQAKYADRTRHAQFLDEVISRLQALPAIAAATPVNVPPFFGRGWDVPRFTAEGQSADRATTNPSLNLESVYPNYFETLGVAIVRGRAFTEADRQGTLQVAIVSEGIAARTWPGVDPIGKRLKMGGPNSADPWYAVVGVAAQTRYRELATPRATLYLPAAQFQMTAQMFVLRTTAPLDLVGSFSRDRVHAVDPDVHVMRVAPFTEMLDAPLARPRSNAFLLSIFGIAALLLSTVGLYAVMGTYVRQRDRDIAVRRALGASTLDVCRLVLGESLWLAGLGAGIGLVGAVGAARVVRGMLYDVDPHDPVMIFGAVLLLMIASILAAYLPARRAARVDPLVALRYE